MIYFTDEEVLNIFRDLPGHRGCSPSELAKVESRFGLTFPRVYRDMMLLDEERHVSTNIITPLHLLETVRSNAEELLAEDHHDFRLSPRDLVFAWDGVFAFFFFTTTGEDDVPVSMFNYYSPNDDDWQPKILFPSLTAYFVDRLRRYLGLDQMIE